MPLIMVLHNDYQYRGGEDVCVEHEFDALRSTGWSIERFSNANERDSRTSAALAIFGLGDESALHRHLKTRRPTILHVHNLFPRYSPRVFRVARRLGIKTVMTLHNFRPLCLNGLYLTPKNEVCERCRMGHYVPGIRRGCYRKSRIQSASMAAHLSLASIRRWYADVDCFIAPSEFLKAKYVAQGFPADNIFVQGHFLPMIPDTLPTAPHPYLLYIGRLAEEKGIRWLLQQFQTPRMPFRLVIAGAGPLEALVKSRIGPTVEHVGYLEGETKDRYLREASALVVPSECYENFPLAIMEANAWGTPALVAQWGGMAEMVRSGRNGAQFEPHNDTSFWSALAQLTRPDTALSMRQSSQTHARRHFGRDAFLAQRIPIYEHLLQRT